MCAQALVTDCAVRWMFSHVCASSSTHAVCTHRINDNHHRARSHITIQLTSSVASAAAWCREPTMWTWAREGRSPYLLTKFIDFFAELICVRLYECTIFVGVVVRKAEEVDVIWTGAHAQTLLSMSLSSSSLSSFFLAFAFGHLCVGVFSIWFLFWIYNAAAHGCDALTDVYVDYAAVKTNKWVCLSVYVCEQYQDMLCSIMMLRFLVYSFLVAGRKIAFCKKTNKGFGVRHARLVCSLARVCHLKCYTYIHGQWAHKHIYRLCISRYMSALFVFRMNKKPLNSSVWRSFDAFEWFN